MKGTVAALVSHIEKTSAAGIIRAVDELYADIRREQEAWLSAVPVFRCPGNCGECCRSFEPDMSECEALNMAAWLLAYRPGLARRTASGIFGSGGGCVFQGETCCGCCTVYGGRPLVCRLFGYCGDRDREGFPRFRLCRFHPRAAGRTYTEERLRAEFSAVPPLMGDFGTRAANMAPGVSNSVFPLRDILPAAVRKVNMLRLMGRSDSAPGGPDLCGGDMPPDYPAAV